MIIIICNYYYFVVIVEVNKDEILALGFSNCPCFLKRYSKQLLSSGSIEEQAILLDGK